MKTLWMPLETPSFRLCEFFFPFAELMLSTRNVNNGFVMKNGGCVQLDGGMIAVEIRFFHCWQVSIESTVEDEEIEVLFLERGSPHLSI